MPGTLIYSILFGEKMLVRATELIYMLHKWVVTYGLKITDRVLDSWSLRVVT